MSKTPTEEEKSEFMLQVVMWQTTHPEEAFTKDELTVLVGMFMSGELEDIKATLEQKATQPE